MGIINKYVTKRCVFCKGRSGNLEFVPDTTIYGYLSDFSGSWYHMECLKDVLCEPEEHGHRKIEVALEISDIIKEIERTERLRWIKVKEACEDIKNYE